MQKLLGARFNVKWLLRCGWPLALATQACGANAPATASAAVSVKAVRCSLEGPKTLVPLATQGGSVALARVGTATIAFVADQDSRRVYAVDVDQRKELGFAQLQGSPAQLLVSKSGRIAVAIPGASQLDVLSFDGQTLSHMCSVPTDTEPVALALTPDERTLLVSSAWGHSLSSFSSAGLQEQFRVSLPREPRAIVVSDDGKRAFVSHALGGVVSAVDLTTRTSRAISTEGTDDRSVRQARTQTKADLERQGTSPEAIKVLLEQAFNSGHPRGSQGFALAKSVIPGGRILAPQVLVDPGRAEQRTQGYGQDNDETQTPSVAVLDADAATPLASSLQVSNRWTRVAALNGEAREECVLPRSTAVDPKSGSLLVTCLGSDLVLGLDSSSAAPAQTELFRVRVATGPTGIAIDAEHRRAFVWSQFERVLTTLALPDTLAATRISSPDASARIALSDAPGPSLELRLGRRLFFASGDPRIAKDGRACASCHIDGRDDGLVWATPNGPRRTKVLAGMVTGTGPYAWDGDAAQLEDQVGRTFERLHGIGGLRGLELEALLSYVRALPAAPPASEPEPDAKAARGAIVFASAEAGCSTCHVGARGTDGQQHDVATRTATDRSGAFDTPALNGIAGRGPYFHDGRYATLRELLERSAGTMGQSSPLSASDREALESYLRTL